MKKRVMAAGLVVSFVVLCVLQRQLEAAEQQQTVEAPRFEVDPAWPKPLPNKWVLGNVIGVGVDARDHVFIVHRNDTLDPQEIGAATNPPNSECCVPAPPVLEFDPAGNVVNAWGGPPRSGENYVWPNSNHGIAIDRNDNVWIGGNGNPDSHILVFTHDGKFIRQIGTPNKGSTPNSNTTEHFGRVAKITHDPKLDEAFVADGYGNRRIAVIDTRTGAIKRFWGAYGNKPDDTRTPPYHPDSALIKQFRTPVHCAEPSNDGLVYVCDRPNDRIQVFKTDGSFVKEVQIKPRTLGDGSVWDIAFSRDPQQKYMFLADGKNERVYVLDRATLSILTEFGDGGRQPGQFFAVHSIVTDSKGNIFTTETYEGKRIQKFRYMGLAKVPRNQGVVWPKGGR